MTREIGGPSGGDNGGGAGGEGGAQMSRFGQPPAFLTKTFQIVNDPNTNSIISWGKFGDSFIIWDYIKFSAEILPNYFRHNNFSSFVYQLNNYGFRKIGVDHQCEYANQDFKKGKQHLLSNMRRRPLQNPTHRQRHRRSLSPKKLRNANDELKKEIEKLKMKQSDTDSHIMALQQQTNNFDTISKKLIVQWAKSLQIIAKRERETHCDHDDDDDVDDEGHVSKREKVVVVSAEIASKSDGKNDEDHHQNEMVKENDDHAAKSKSAEIDGNFSNDLSWMKKHFEEEDDEVCEVEGDASNLHAKIAKDFQELLTDQADADHFYLEMKIGFTELLTNQADADHYLEIK